MSNNLPSQVQYINEYLKNELHEENLGNYNKDIYFIETNSFILYICTYSNFSGENFFKKELLLIEKILSICEKNGQYLYVRPHPHFIGNEFEKIKDSPYLYIGKPAEDASYSCIFKTEDQAFKIKLLQEANLIINVGTTLVLEASLLNEEIVQLNLNYEDFYGFSRACSNHHINSYLLNKKDVVYISTDSIILGNMFQAKKSRFSTQLNSFFTKIIRTISRRNCKISLMKIYKLISKIKVLLRNFKFHLLQKYSLAY